MEKGLAVGHRPVVVIHRARDSRRSGAGQDMALVETNRGVLRSDYTS